MNREDTTFLRFIAICLVLNSHLDLYYPVDHIGTGGAIGNALFFMLSAFGLLLSEKKRPQNFFTYFTKRIRRIYPSVWIVLLFFVFPFQISPYTIEFKKVIILFSRCLYPPFWFLKALILYYIIGFFLIKNYSKGKIVFVMAIAFMVYLFFYLHYLDLTTFSVEKMPFKVFFYIMIFMFGIFLAGINEKIRFSGISDVIICFASIFILYGHKYLMTIHIVTYLQMVQQLILFVLVFYALKISRSSFIRFRIMQMPILGNMIRYISKITLELYIVHATISPFILKQNYSFPINMFIFLCASISIAAIINWAVNKILSYPLLEMKKNTSI